MLKEAGWRQLVLAHEGGHHIEHSNDLFSFRCKHKTEPEVECWFLPCFGAGCRANHRAAFATAPPEPNCGFLHYTK